MLYESGDFSLETSISPASYRITMLVTEDTEYNADITFITRIEIKMATGQYMVATLRSKTLKDARLFVNNYGKLHFIHKFTIVSTFVGQFEVEINFKKT